MSVQTKEDGSRPRSSTLPVEKMREGYYTDEYFNQTRRVLLEDGEHPRVVMQVFQKKTSVLAGIDEAIAILKLCSDDWEGLTVHALYDGDEIAPWETVMTIEGDYTLFAHLETLYLGVLARRTMIASNVKRVVEAANGKPIIFMPARYDHHRVQTGDGRGAHVAGATIGAPIGVTTDAKASWWGGRAIGTVPHALISSYGGNTVLAATKFAEWAIRTPTSSFWSTSRTTRSEPRSRWRVRSAIGSGASVSTSRTMVDRSLWHELGDFDPRGVNDRLVNKVRDASTATGSSSVKIVVSGGFNAERSASSRRRASPSTPTASARR